MAEKLQPPDKLVAFIADGEDSFCAMRLDGAWYPAVTNAMNADTLAAMERTMRFMAMRSGITIRKYEFTQRTEVAVFHPAGVPAAKG